MENGTGEVIIKLGNSCSLVDENFKEILPMEYSSIQSLGFNDLFLVSDISDYYAKKYLTKKGIVF